MTHLTPSPREVAKSVQELISSGATTWDHIVSITGLSARQLRRRLHGEVPFSAHDFIVIVNNPLPRQATGPAMAATPSPDPEDGSPVTRVPLSDDRGPSKIDRRPDALHNRDNSSPTINTLPKRGDQFEFGPEDAPVTTTVTRVSTQGLWVDLRCVGPGGWTWSKRQKLPLPFTFRPSTS